MPYTPRWDRREDSSFTAAFPMGPTVGCDNLAPRPYKNLLLIA
jgi:hypothetical protein